MLSEMLSPAVERAMRAVPRVCFVPPAWRARAETDEPLPIGFGQTISQPSLVGHMIEELAVGPTSRVLEIGTGSGYETAVLAELVGEVYTIERLPVLAEAAQAKLEPFRYRNIRFRTGDGALGWPEAAPFDAIIVSAAADTAPPALIDQLGEGGRLLIPIGPPHGEQELVCIEKLVGGDTRWNELCGVRFVPLVAGTP